LQAILAAAKLAALWRVDVPKTNALAVNFECVAVTFYVGAAPSREGEARPCLSREVGNGVNEVLDEPH
jgi:hypothetical protein